MEAPRHTEIFSKSEDFNANSIGFTNSLCSETL